MQSYNDVITYCQDDLILRRQALGFVPKAVVIYAITSPEAKCVVVYILHLELQVGKEIRHLSL